MDYEQHFKEQEVWFSLTASEPELIDNAALIHLVSMKFDGEIVHSSKFEGVTDTFYTFKVKFPSWTTCSNAKAHCDRNMDSFGNVVRDYKGALDAADPARKMSEELLKLVDHHV